MRPTIGFLSHKISMRFPTVFRQPLCTTGGAGRFSPGGGQIALFPSLKF